jgi:hypothetical protein
MDIIFSDTYILQPMNPLRAWNWLTFTQVITKKRYNTLRLVQGNDVYCLDNKDIVTKKKTIKI